MTDPQTPALELSVDRHIAAPPERVWEIMTTRMPDWFCPKPWYVEVIEQDWRPGGRSAMVMHGPNGEEMPQEGVFLEVIPGRRFVFTDAFAAGWQPRGPLMVGARHWTMEAMEQHKTMGFVQGWGAVADQLAALAEE